MKPAKILLLSGVLVAVCLASIVAVRFRSQHGGPGEARDSRIKWAYNAGPGALSGIALAPSGTIHFAGADGLYALSPEGQLVWKTPLPSGPVVAAPTISPDGTQYFASQSGKLFALDASGKLIWESASTQHRLSTPPTFSEGALYVTDDYSDLFAFAPGLDANLRWKLTTYDAAADKDGVLLGYNPSGNGWQYTSPVISPNGIVYLAHQSWLYQISPEGDILHFTPYYGGTPGFPAIGPDGTIYIGGHNWPALAAVDREGKSLWGTRTSSAVQGSPVIDNAGVLYLCDSDFVKAYTPDGKQKWYLQMPCNSGPVLAADGTLYLGFNGPPPKMGPPQSYFPAISSDGQLEWKFEVHGMVRDAAAIAPDGTIFFTTDQGYVYAVNGSGAPPMDSPWPRFQHDAQNSGRLPFYH
jgi:outer membrane protein assembly factor BamB